MEMLLGAEGRRGEGKGEGRIVDITREGVQRRHMQQVLISLPAIYSHTELPEIQVSTCNLGSSFGVSLQY